MCFCCVLGECRESLAEQLSSAMFPAGIMIFVCCSYCFGWFGLFLLFLLCFLISFFWGGLVWVCVAFAWVYVLCFVFCIRHIVDLFLCVFVAFWVSAVRALLSNSLAPCFRPVSLFLFVDVIVLFVSFFCVYLHWC